ncbi:hypothetical protein D3C86_1467870 [compost metagenome]
MELRLIIIKYLREVEEFRESLDPRLVPIIRDILLGILDWHIRHAIALTSESQGYVAYAEMASDVADSGLLAYLADPNGSFVYGFASIRLFAVFHRSTTASGITYLVPESILSPDEAVALKSRLSHLFP